MLDFLNEIWTQIYAYRWLYLYSAFACIMIRWSWHLSDQRYTLPENGLLNNENQLGSEIVEEALPANETLNFEKNRTQNEGNPSVTL